MRALVPFRIVSLAIVIATTFHLALAHPHGPRGRGPHHGHHLALSKAGAKALSAGESVTAFVHIPAVLPPFHFEFQLRLNQDVSPARLLVNEGSGSDEAELEVGNRTSSTALTMAQIVHLPMRPPVLLAPSEAGNSRNSTSEAAALCTITTEDKDDNQNKLVPVHFEILPFSPPFSRPHQERSDDFESALANDGRKDVPGGAVGGIPTHFPHGRFKGSTVDSREKVVLALSLPTKSLGTSFPILTLHLPSDPEASSRIKATLPPHTYPRHPHRHRRPQSLVVPSFFADSIQMFRWILRLGPNSHLPSRRDHEFRGPFGEPEGAKSPGSNGIDDQESEGEGRLDRIFHAFKTDPTTEHTEPASQASRGDQTSSFPKRRDLARGHKPRNGELLLLPPQPDRHCRNHRYQHRGPPSNFRRWARGIRIFLRRAYYGLLRKPLPPRRHHQGRGAHGIMGPGMDCKDVERALWIESAARQISLADDAEDRKTPSSSPLGSPVTLKDESGEYSSVHFDFMPSFSSSPFPSHGIPFDYYYADETIERQGLPYTKDDQGCSFTTIFFAVPFGFVIGTTLERMRRKGLAEARQHCPEDVLHQRGEMEKVLIEK